MQEAVVSKIEEFFVLLWRAKYFKPVIKEQLIGKVAFKLWIAGGDAGAQMTYSDVRSARKGGAYEEIMVECLSRILSFFPSPSFMDIGAFMGYYANFVSGFFNDKFTVYAVESNGEYCECVKKSAAINGFKNLKIYEAVLSDKQESLVVNKLTVTTDNPQGVRKISVTLDDLCRKEGIRPNILKVDVHGAEGKVLGGAQRILRENVNFVLFELHPDDYLAKYSPGYKRIDILNNLSKNGFRNYLIGGFRYSRSPEREIYRKTGEIIFMEIVPENHKMLFFDRHVDLFVLSMRNYTIEKLPKFRNYLNY